jgi:hypothetical protein
MENENATASPEDVSATVSMIFILSFDLLMDGMVSQVASAGVTSAGDIRNH